MQPFSSQPSDSSAYSCEQTLEVAWNSPPGRWYSATSLSPTRTPRQVFSATSLFAATRTQSPIVLSLRLLVPACQRNSFGPNSAHQLAAIHRNDPTGGGGQVHHRRHHRLCHLV